jgi:GH43 family beta-xylosidase
MAIEFNRRSLMKKKVWVPLALIVACVASIAIAAPAVRGYQVTGPVLEVTETKIVVQKGDDRWELARDTATECPATIKVGDKVTVEYRMVATSVTTK